MGAKHMSGPLFVDGVPIGGGGIPTTFGKVIYVNSDTNAGSDSYDGLTMKTPKATLAAAYALATTNAHDVIVLSGNTAHVLTDELVVAKNRVHFLGLDPAPGRRMGQRARITMGVTTGTAIAAIKVTGVGCTFTNLKISSADTLATSLYAVADGGEFSVWTNCWLEKSTDLDQTTAAELLCNADTPLYNNCTIGNMIYTKSVARTNVLFTRETIAGKVARDVEFRNCLFQNRTTATTAIFGKATTNDIERMCLFEGCMFWNAKTSSATQALVFAIASALTDAQILLKDCVVQNVTDVCATGLGVFTNSPTPVAAATESISVALT